MQEQTVLHEIKSTNGIADKDSDKGYEGYFSEDEPRDAAEVPDYRTNEDELEDSIEVLEVEGYLSGDNALVVNDDDNDHHPKNMDLFPGAWFNMQMGGVDNGQQEVAILPTSSILADYDEGEGRRVSVKGRGSPLFEKNEKHTIKV